MSLARRFPKHFPKHFPVRFPMRFPVLGLRVSRNLKEYPIGLETTDRAAGSTALSSAETTCHPEPRRGLLKVQKPDLLLLFCHHERRAKDLPAASDVDLRVPP
jgi:hypothetical protein